MDRGPTPEIQSHTTRASEVSAKICYIRLHTDMTDSKLCALQLVCAIFGIKVWKGNYGVVISDVLLV